MKSIQTINGSWSDEANGWVSDTLELTGDAYLEVELPTKGRLVIKKAVPDSCPVNGSTAVVTWPKALITPWSGPQFRIRIYGTTKAAQIKIITTDTPTRIQLANI